MCVCVCVPDELDMILCGVAIKPICLSCHAAILWLRGGGAFWSSNVQRPSSDLLSIVFIWYNMCIKVWCYSVNSFRSIYIYFFYDIQCLVMWFIAYHQSASLHHSPFSPSPRFSQEQIGFLLDELFDETNLEALARHPFANFVVQHIFEHGMPERKGRCFQMLLPYAPWQLFSNWE